MVDPYGTSSVLPKYMAADNEFPLINIQLYPVPAASPGTITINSWTALTAFGDVTDTISLPQGYERALHLGLAVELWPQYPKGNFAQLKGIADDAKNSLMQLTQQMLASGQPATPPAQPQVQR